MPLTSSTLYSDHAKGEHHPDTVPSDEPVVAKPLSLSNVWRASRTWLRAFVNDPYVEYLEEGSKPNAWSLWLGYCTILVLWYKSQIMFTAESGAALNIDLHYPSKPRSHFDKLKDRLVQRLWIVISSKKTPEQIKRNAENRAKMAACVKGAIRPERLPEMYQVALVATDPDFQGRGLGSAILTAMTQLADKEGRASWLISSNVVNNAFYNANGFFTVGSYFLGDQNPLWTKKPVQVQIMVREPKIALERPWTSQVVKKMTVITPSACFDIEI